MTKLTEADRSQLAFEEDAAGYTTVDTDELFMDSHGCNVVVVVIQPIGQPDAPLEAFTYRYSSEEAFHEDEPDETVLVTPRQVTITKYDRADGTRWSDHV